MPKSNNSGRSLEYIIVNKIIDSLPDVEITVTDRLTANQTRDKEAFIQLPDKQQKEYRSYADTVFSWLNEEFSLSSKSKITLDRLSDFDAMGGDVTDIRITFEDTNVNLSVKHNHSAVKHQRPENTVVQMGFDKSSPKDIEFRKSIQIIFEEFDTKVKSRFPTATLFNQIKSDDSDFLNINLYLPVCKLVSHFIKSNGGQPGKASHLFSFLVGNTHFYKITASANQVNIEQFAKIEPPIKVDATVEGNSYVILKFSNGWILKMRLHTASSRLSMRPSLKFDTQLVGSKIPKKTLICEELANQ